MPINIIVSANLFRANQTDFPLNPLGESVCVSCVLFSEATASFDRRRLLKGFAMNEVKSSLFVLHSHATAAAAGNNN